MILNVRFADTVADRVVAVLGILIVGIWVLALTSIIDDPTVKYSLGSASLFGVLLAIIGSRKLLFEKAFLQKLKLD